MSIAKKYKEIVQVTKSNQKGSKESAKIPDKFKKLLKSKRKTPHEAAKGNTKKEITKIPGRHRRYSDKKLLRILKAEAMKLGRTPTCQYFQNSKNLPSVITYTSRWGSWNNAVKAAGLEPNLVISKSQSNRKKSSHVSNNSSTIRAPRTIKEFQKVQLYATLSDKEANGENVILQLGKQLNLDSPHIDQAADLYEEIIERGLQRGRTVKSIASATVYLTCRQATFPRTLGEIAQASGVSTKKLSHATSALAKKLKLELPPFQPLDFFDRIASQLLLPEDVKASTKSILHNPTTKRFSIGKNPMSILAASIYIGAKLCRKSITQDEIAKVADVTTVTIRNRYKELVEKLDIDKNIFD